MYTVGVARPYLEIARQSLTSFDYTMRGNTVAGAVAEAAIRTGLARKTLDPGQVQQHLKTFI